MIETVWPKHSAGNKMITAVPTVLPSQTVGEIQIFLKKNIGRFDTINYFYVVDEKKRLRGVFTIKDIYRWPKEEKIEKFYKKTHLVTITPRLHQEKAAFLALKHNIKAIPVVDEDDRFLGVVPNDAILSILYRKAREDVLHFAGIHPKQATFDSILEIPLIQALAHRLPWLLIGMFGGLIAAHIVSLFETTLTGNLVLVAFIPLVVYMADAVGTQIEVFAIRDLAIFHKLSYSRYFFKHFLIVLLLALIIGTALAGVNLILFGSVRLALVVSLAIVFAIISSLFTGLLIPYLFLKLKFDPANASGPIATIIQDVLSVSIYFTIASWLLE